MFEASEGTRHAGTLWRLENKVWNWASSMRQPRTRLVIPLRFVLVVAGKKGPPRKNPVALAGTEAWLGGGAILRRLVFSVEVDLVALPMQPH